MTKASASPILRSWWRKLGLAAIALAALMAAAAVPTGILNDTVIHVVRLSGRELPPDISHSISASACLAYWLLFAAALATSLVMATIDVRQIRREFALQKQALLRESLGEDLTKATLRRGPRR